MASSSYSYSIIITCLHTVIEFQVFQSNTNDFLWFDFGISNPYGLFDVKILFIHKYLIVIMTIFNVPLHVFIWYHQLLVYQTNNY